MDFVNLKVGQSLTLDTPKGPVVVSLQEVRKPGDSGKVRLGFEADPSIPIHRENALSLMKHDQDRPILRGPIDVNRAKRDSEHDCT